MDKLIDGRRIVVVRGDITTDRSDAIVNAANSSLMGGGGVDGAIHRAGGPAILEECKRYVDAHGRLPAGQAMITTAGRMPARYVIHTVGPVWHGRDRDEPATLSSAYRESLRIAEEYDLQSVAFPSISTGAYGYPVEKAAQVAVETVAWFLTHDARSLSTVTFVLFDDSPLGHYVAALDRYE